MRLKGKVVVIVGGTGGIGLSAARAMLAEEARVVVVGRGEDRVRDAEREMGAFARALAGDASDPQVSERAIDLACEAFGRFDGLYHVAGASGRSQGDGPLHELTDDGIDHTLRINLTALLYSNRAAVRRLLKTNTAGAILNMTSVLGVSPAPQYFGTITYAAAKAAVIGVTRSAAAMYAPRNIRFNAIAPALVDTPMAQRAVGDDAIQTYIQQRQPLDGGRVGRPDDLDGAAVMLLSDESRFITGQLLCVDGGWCVSDTRSMP